MFTKCFKVFCFFFSKKKAFFFEKKKQKTFIHWFFWLRLRGLAGSG